MSASNQQLFSAKAAKYIHEVCTLQRAIGLVNVMHDITFGKGQISMLVSDENIFNYYYENKIPTLCTDESGRTLADGIYLNTVLQKSYQDCAVLMPLLPKVGRQYDIDYGKHSIHVVEREADCQHLYSLFFNVEEKKFLHWVVNNGDFLRDFIADYKYRLRDVVLEAKAPESRIKLPHYNTQHISLLLEEHGLSPRQVECLYYLVKGMTIKEIGKKLNLSPRTVEHYMDRVKEKLNCSSRAELIFKAVQLGFLHKERI